MIAFVKGILKHKTPTTALIDNNGIGLSLLIPLSTFEVLGNLKDSVQLLTYLHVREDALILFGFATENERELFLDLLSVSGIGPKLALGIISGSNSLQIYNSISNGDEEALLRIKGLGKKTAQRLIIDLKDKARLKADKDIQISGLTDQADNKVLQEAMLAMISLGYSKNEAVKTITKALSNNTSDMTVEELLKAALSG
jgi:holliday junction DNA helicase RuvA